MATVYVGQYITAATMNNKLDSEDLVTFGKAIDEKFNKLIFVGTDYQWYSLSAAERAKYMMRGVPK